MIRGAMKEAKRNTDEVVFDDMEWINIVEKYIENRICKFCKYYKFEPTEDWGWCMFEDGVNVVIKVEDNFGCNKFVRDINEEDYSD